MNYTELYEHIYDVEYTTQEELRAGIAKRIEALDPATRLAWNMLEVLKGRKGFDFDWWFDGFENDGDELRDEIFAELVEVARKADPA